MHGFASYQCFRKVRSLHSDRAWFVRGPIAILELFRVQFGYVFVALGQSVFGSIEIRIRIYHEALCEDSLYEI